MTGEDLQQLRHIVARLPTMDSIGIFSPLREGERLIVPRAKALPRWRWDLNKPSENASTFWSPAMYSCTRRSRSDDFVTFSLRASIFFSKISFGVGAAPTASPDPTGMVFAAPYVTKTHTFHLLYLSNRSAIVSSPRVRTSEARISSTRIRSM